MTLAELLASIQSWSSSWEWVRLELSYLLQRKVKEGIYEQLQKTAKRQELGRAGEQAKKREKKKRCWQASRWNIRFSCRRVWW